MNAVPFWFERHSPGFGIPRVARLERVARREHRCASGSAPRRWERRLRGVNDGEQA